MLLHQPIERRLLGAVAFVLHRRAIGQPAAIAGRSGRCVYAKEGGREKPEYPWFFYRGKSSLIAAGQPGVVPRASERLDYEAELAVVIGRKVPHHLVRADALQYVFGYTCFNDMSVRDYQRRTPQWTIGKNFDGTGGFGPILVSADELPPGATGLDEGRRHHRDRTDRRAAQSGAERFREEQMEVANLSGNIAQVDGEPSLHVHVTLGRRDYSALAGHLLDAQIRGACELFVRPLAAALVKVHDPAIGLNLYTFDASA